MCYGYGTLMANVTVETWDFTCGEVNIWVDAGEAFDCDSTTAEFARAQCCDNYVVECNSIFLSKNPKIKIKKCCFACDVKQK